MNVVFSKRFTESFHDAPERQQRQLEKQLAFLLTDLRHPSLRAKIVDEGRRVWQARVDSSWRFYFQIRGDAYFLLDMVPHPK